MIRKLSKQAMEKLLADERTTATLAAAIGKVQRGKKRLDKTQAEVMKAFHFATQADFKALGKKLAGLKRRIRDLDERLDQVE